MHGVAVDVYIETWEDSCTTQMARQRWFHKYHPNLTHLSIDKLPVDAGKSLHNVTLPAKLWNLSSMNDPIRRKNYLSAMPHSWKMYQCSEAIAAHETSRGFKYDAIVKARPDARFWHEEHGIVNTLPHVLHAVLSKDHSEGRLYHFLGGADGRRQLSDKYAVGTSRVMHWFLRIMWTTIRDRLAADPEAIFEMGENMLFGAMRTPGLHITAKGIASDGKATIKGMLARPPHIWQPSGFAELDNCTAVQVYAEAPESPI